MGCWGLLGWLLIVIVDHSRKFPAFCTSKINTLHRNGTCLPGVQPPVSQRERWQIAKLTPFFACLSNKEESWLPFALHGLVLAPLRQGRFRLFWGIQKSVMQMPNQSIMSYLPNTTQLGLAGIASFCRDPASFVAQTSQVWCRNAVLEGPAESSSVLTPPHVTSAYQCCERLHCQYGSMSLSASISASAKIAGRLANWVTSFFSLWLQYLGKLLYFINLNLEVYSHFGMISLYLNHDSQGSGGQVSCHLLGTFHAFGYPSVPMTFTWRLFAPEWMTFTNDLWMYDVWIVCVYIHIYICIHIYIIIVNYSV